MENSFDEQRRLDIVRKKVESIKGFYKHLAAYILVNIFLLATKWFTLDPGEEFLTFGTFSTAFFWGFGLLLHGIGVFGTNIFLGNNWEEKKIRELMDKNRDQGSKWE